MADENNCIFEMFDFMKFSRANEEFKGTCLFKVEKDDGVVLKSVRLEPEQPVVVYDGLPPDGKVTVEISLGYDTFHQLYLNELDAKKAVLTGKVRVKYFKYSALSSFMGSFDMSTERWNEYYKWKANEDKRMAKFAPTTSATPAAALHHVSQLEALLQSALPYMIEATRDADVTSLACTWPPIMSHFDNGTTLPPKPSNPAVFRQNLLALARVVADAHVLHTQVAPSLSASLDPTPTLEPAPDTWSSLWAPVTSLFTSAPQHTPYGDMENVKDTMQALAALADSAADAPADTQPASVLSYITGLLPASSAPASPADTAVSLGVAAYHRLGPVGDALPELLVTEAERLADEGVVLDYTSLQQQKPSLLAKLTDADPAIDARVTRWLMTPRIDEATQSRTRRHRFLDYFSDLAVPIDGAHLEETSQHIVKPLPPFAPSTEPRRVLADLERVLAKGRTAGAPDSPDSGPSTPLGAGHALSAAFNSAAAAAAAATASASSATADTRSSAAPGGPAAPVVAATMSPPPFSLADPITTTTTTDTATPTPVASTASIPAPAPSPTRAERLAALKDRFRARTQGVSAALSSLGRFIDDGWGAVVHAQELSDQHPFSPDHPLAQRGAVTADAPAVEGRRAAPILPVIAFTMGQRKQPAPAPVPAPAVDAAAPASASAPAPTPSPSALSSRPMIQHLLDTMKASVVHPDRARNERKDKNNQ